MFPIKMHITVILKLDTDSYLTICMCYSIPDVIIDRHYDLLQDIEY